MPDHQVPKLGQTQGSDADGGQSSCIKPFVNNDADGLCKKNSFALNRWLKESKKDEPFNLLALANKPHLHHADGTALAVNPWNSTSSLGNICVSIVAEARNGNKAPGL